MKEIVLKAMDILRSLNEKLGETTGLGSLAEDRMTGVVLAASDGLAGFSFHIDAGYRFPLHASAPGKVLLAYLPPAERDAILAKLDFKPFTPSTITGVEDFKAELEHGMAKGFAIDVAEHIEGCHCVGVPVFNEAREVVASIWTTGPSSQLPLRNFNRISEVLKNGAQELSQRLCSTGHSPNRDYIIGVVNQAKNIIDNNLYTAIDVQKLAENLYVSYSWFRKTFKEQTGQAPADYHLNRRIEKAVELLKNTDLSIRKISEELGFKNQNHFSALVKRKTGTSPTCLRQQFMGQSGTSLDPKQAD
ncbi:MAG: helix-turn-helix domain-containing protein [Kiritimatiellales bacterium]|nr:helix-turn-helix domain-containing protein [Kiritimatiellales bacterium]